MDDVKKAQIIEIEEKLRSAMLTSDVTTLDKLLASDLIFINHLGHLISKEDDLNAHRCGLIKIDQLDVSEQTIRVHKDTATVTARTRIKGEFQGHLANIDLRFTRVWVKEPINVNWQVSVAHSCLVTDVGDK